ncbi:S1/P1 nuclease [Mucilaginibacter ginkgonis]|uniref:Uncharacterized protein n=1 Tax=Mucilaginibacter ginkgonis TaxID=2682091 RepID=A0A6I4HVA8_9SPHI|nr:S1/P1 nuclease [Mucilaginibacter ginkgonis]QQL50126.1 hypothetical protein GO620_001360 [Mucilaginibacter ginkgonis]
MKRRLISSLVVLSTLTISWDREGHSIVGLIAERHLTPQAKAAIKELLNGQSLSEVASWADEVRNQPQYKYSAPQHFANFPGGLTYKQFIDYANGGDIGPNVIFAIPMTEAP